MGHDENENYRNEEIIDKRLHINGVSLSWIICGHIRRMSERCYFLHLEKPEQKVM